MPHRDLAWSLGVGRPGDDTAWQGEGSGGRTGLASPFLGLGGGESLPKLLASAAVDVLHFPYFLQRVTRKIAVMAGHHGGSLPPKRPAMVLAGAPPIDSTLPHFLGFPTWEISARMIPRYCLPCPRASMAAKNSFLSWTSFTTAQRGRAISAQGSGSAQGPRQHMASEGERGRGGGGKVYSKSCSLVSPISSTHTYSHSSNRSSSGAGSSCCTRGAVLRSSMSFPVAKIFWSLRFSFSRSPVGPRDGLVKGEEQSFPLYAAGCRG